MARPGVSLAALTEMYRQESGDGLLILVTLDHDDLPAPERFVRDFAPCVSLGRPAFRPLALDVVLPAEEESGSPAARLTVDNVDRRLMPVLRAFRPFMRVDIELVRMNDPDDRVQRWPKLLLTEASTPDPVSWEGSLGYPDYSLSRYPKSHYVESLYPALARAL